MQSLDPQRMSRTRTSELHSAVLFGHLSALSAMARDSGRAHHIEPLRRPPEERSSAALGSSSK